MPLVFSLNKFEKTTEALHTIQHLEEEFVIILDTNAVTKCIILYYEHREAREARSSHTQ